MRLGSNIRNSIYVLSLSPLVSVRLDSRAELLVSLREVPQSATDLCRRRVDSNGNEADSVYAPIRTCPALRRLTVALLAVWWSYVNGAALAAIHFPLKGHLDDRATVHQRTTFSRLFRESRWRRFNRQTPTACQRWFTLPEIRSGL